MCIRDRYAYCGNRPIGSVDTTGFAERKPIWADIGKPKTQADLLAEQESAPGNLLAVPGGGANKDGLASFREGRVTDWNQWGHDLRAAADETSKNVLVGVLALYAIGALAAGGGMLAGAALGAETGTVLGAGVVASAEGGVAGFGMGVFDEVVQQQATYGEVESYWDVAAQGATGGAVGAFTGFGLVLSFGAAERLTSAMRRAGAAQWTDYLGAAGRIVRKQRAGRVADVDVLAVDSPFATRVDPAQPGRPDPRYSIDSGTFTSGVATSNGGLRNAQEFWTQWATLAPESLSASNRFLLSLIHI